MGIIHMAKSKKTTTKKTQEKGKLAPAFKNSETKSKKKSKHGKKNWRKNIDITDVDEKTNKINETKLAEKNLQLAKDEDLFTMDINPLGNKAGNTTVKKKKGVRS